MYNRYIPQQDGTFQKNRVQPHEKPCTEQSPCPPPQPEIPVCKKEESASSFLKQLIPKNIDTGDLLIIILLLLMAGDSEENKGTWLLTLALYLFF